jgi:flagellar biosynthesis protein FlhA
MIASLRRALGAQADLVLVVTLVGILLILFTPIPPGLLDFLLIANFTFALLILLLTFYMEKPLEFSTFPSLLLIATLFRLALNVSATRLILSEANAGNVIGAVGEHVVGGNYVIGLIVFLVLIVVQYVVVTNGAQRVAEVAARFTLDSMPGKQMSIDADLNMGLIDQNEARDRRKNIEREANFYGSMDGASRFVKGDAIAGIIIVLINIIGGLAIGIAQKGMSWAEALHTYTLLTVGDGIVTQVPALVIATSTGIIVTRAATDGQLGSEVTKQLMSHPKTLVLAAICLFGLVLLPGIPMFPVALLFGAVVLLYIGARRVRKEKIDGKAQAGAAGEAGGEDLYGMLAVEPIEIAVGQNLIPIAGGDNSLFMERIVAFRKQFALDMGAVFPRVRIKDNKKQGPNHYEIRIYGTRVVEGEILADRLLAINPGGERAPLEGVVTTDPTYGLAAVWVVDDQKKRARDAGYTVVDPTTVLLTHLTEVIKQQAPNLLTRAETERLVNRLRQEQSSLLDELVPKILSLGEVQKVMQNLLREKVPIRNIEAILEVLADIGVRNKDADYLTEQVRERLGATICQTLVSQEGDLHVLTFDPSVEQTITGALRMIEDKSALVMEPRVAEQVLRRLSAEVERMMANNHMPVLLCSPVLRRHVRRFTERLVPQLSVLSLSEVPSSVSLRAFGMVTV